MAAGAEGHWLMVDWRKCLASGVAHCARRVIHGTQEHAREWQCHVVLGFGFPAPLAPFHSPHTFSVDEIWPGAHHSRGLLVTVEIDNEMAFRSFSQHAPKVLEHDLITALHEVNLDSLDAPLFKLIHRRNQLVIKCLPRRP